MERLKKALFIVASSLLFCFPVYADEPEAADLPIEEVLHDVELINDSTKEASEVSIDNLAEIQGGMVKSPSINPNSNFRVLGYTLYKGSDDNHLIISFYVVGNGTIYANITPSNATPADYAANQNNNYIIPISLNENGFTLPITFNSYRYLENNILIGSQDVNLTITDASNLPVYNEHTANIQNYLSNVAQIFTWLLTTIGTLISFILANPFLAVSLLLFMAGAVISFYARIKNS